MHACMVRAVLQSGRRELRKHACLAGKILACMPIIPGCGKPMLPIMPGPSKPGRMPSNSLRGLAPGGRAGGGLGGPLPPMKPSPLPNLEHDNQVRLFARLGLLRDILKELCKGCKA